MASLLHCFLVDDHFSSFLGYFTTRLVAAVWGAVEEAMPTKREVQGEFDVTDEFRKAECWYLRKSACDQRRRTMGECTLLMYR